LSERLFNLFDLFRDILLKEWAEFYFDLFALQHYHNRNRDRVAHHGLPLDPFLEMWEYVLSAKKIVMTPQYRW